MSIRRLYTGGVADKSITFGPPVSDVLDRELAHMIMLKIITIKVIDLYICGTRKYVFTFSDLANCCFVVSPPVPPVSFMLPLVRCARTRMYYIICMCVCVWLCFCG